MLEHLHLWLAAWSACDPAQVVCRPGGPPPRWAVFDSASREFLGIVRFSDRWVDSWFGWFSGPVVEVFETPDESFLMRTWRSWGAWRVCDAEGRSAGTIRANDVRDPLGVPMAALTTAPDGSGYWQSPQGRELGTFRAADDGIRASFSPELLDEDPFVRMVLLATLLRME
jgi:hypothetical protein